MAAQKGDHPVNGGQNDPRPSPERQRSQAASASSPKRKGLSQETIDTIKRDVLYGVGYKKPPKETQFKKGHSGNPKGRPKKVEDIGPAGDRSITNIILKEAARKVTIREGDETREIATIEAVVRAQHVSAIRGNSAYAQKHIIERYDRAEREHQRETKEDIELWTNYKERVSTLFAEAEKAGEPPPDVFPHPDDVVIDYQMGVRFVGPIDKPSTERLQKRLELRDLLYMQSVLEDRIRLDEPQYRNTAVLFAQALNNVVPARFRLTEVQVQTLIQGYEVTPKRQLLKMVYRAWRAFGLPRRRGWLLPRFRAGRLSPRIVCRGL